MKVLLLSVLVYLVQAQQTCDTNKIGTCVSTLTNTITQDPNIATDQSQLCDLFQTYVNCLLNEACAGVPMPDNIKQQVESSLSQYGFECDLNFGSSGGDGGNNGGDGGMDGGSGDASRLAGVPYYLTLLIAAVASLFAL